LLLETVLYFSKMISIPNFDKRNGPVVGGPFFRVISQRALAFNDSRVYPSRNYHEENQTRPFVLDFQLS